METEGEALLSREYTITYRGALEPNETLVAGRFPNPGNAASTDVMPEVSIEENVRQRFNIGVGDVMRFDVLGVRSMRR